MEGALSQDSAIRVCRRFPGPERQRRIGKGRNAGRIHQAFEYCEFTEFSEPREFLGYVATVARHSALDLIKREGKYVTGLDLTLCDFLPGTPTPRQHERAKIQLHDLLEELDSEDKLLVNMLMEGSSLDEIAERLSISYANAAVRIHRLREKLLNGLKVKRL